MTTGLLFFLQVTLFDGVFQYVNSKPKSPPQSKVYSKYPHTRLMKFAEEAVVELKRACSSAIIDGLVRVDIFETQMGKLVVNEFESLEACYYHNNESEVCAKLVEYWHLKIQECVGVLF